MVTVIQHHTLPVNKLSSSSSSLPSSRHSQQPTTGSPGNNNSNIECNKLPITIQLINRLSLASGWHRVRSSGHTSLATRQHACVWPHQHPPTIGHYQHANTTTIEYCHCHTVILVIVIVITWPPGTHYLAQAGVSLAITGNNWPIMSSGTITAGLLSYQ